MVKDYKTRLEEAQSLADIFEVVKSLVQKETGKCRGGLMLGMANLGNSPEGFLGGFFTIGSNIIVMNRIPLQRIGETRPELYKPYAFYILLHEYIHSLGYLNEGTVRAKSLEITKEAFGEEHLATQMAANAEAFMENLIYPNIAWKPDDERLELVEGFDRSSVSYIA
jgi:hypothetical protein